MGRKSLIKPDRQRPNSWTTFKENIANLIIEALMLLRQRDDLVKDERILNRLLQNCFVEANAKLRLDYIPAPEAKNSPHPEDKQKAKRENNMPDLSWNIMDHEASYRDWNRNFVLECKRLGMKTSKDWIPTEQYVIAGILRFFQEEKGYGKGCETGAMVAYVQDMELEEILSEVNTHLSKNEPSIPLLVFPSIGWQQQGVSRLHHTFSRSYIPFIFSLQHFWIDMKDCLYLPSSLDTQEISNKDEEIVTKL